MWLSDHLDLFVSVLQRTRTNWLLLYVLNSTDMAGKSESIECFWVFFLRFNEKYEICPAAFFTGTFASEVCQFVHYEVLEVVFY